MGIGAEETNLGDPTPSPRPAGVKRHNPPPGFKQTEAGVIPEDWVSRCLQNLIEFANGRPHEADTAEHGPFLLITLDSIDADGRLKAEHKRVDCNDGSLRKNDIVTVLSTVVSNLDQGNILGLSDLIPEDDTYVLNQRMGRLRMKVDGNPRFVCLQMNRRRDHFKKRAQGSSQKHIYKRDIDALAIPFPPMAEQRAVVDALSDADRALGALEALIGKKRAIKQAAMQQLLTGKTRLPGFSGDWQTQRLDDLAAIDPENLSSSTDPDFGFNYISLEQVDAGRLIGVSEEVFRTAPSRARRVLRDNDVLMSTVRPNLMAHLHFRSQVSRAVCSTGFAVLRSHPDRAEAGFLFEHLFERFVNNQIDRILAGSNYPAISTRDVRAIEVPCPPTVAEQIAIASVLFDMDAEIDVLQARHAKTRAIRQGMMQQLLTGRVRLVEAGVAA